jgi:DNA-binding IclR family transcriptional regulator
VLLAYLSETEFLRTLPSELKRFTPHTITDRTHLRQELAQARERGFAIAQEEMEQGLNVVAAPIRNHAGSVIAAVSIAGPAYRVTPETFQTLAARLVEKADQISQHLGYKHG